MRSSTQAPSLQPSSTCYRTTSACALLMHVGKKRQKNKNSTEDLSLKAWANFICIWTRQSIVSDAFLPLEAVIHMTLIHLIVLIAQVRVWLGRYSGRPAVPTPAHPGELYHTSNRSCEQIGLLALLSAMHVTGWARSDCVQSRVQGHTPLRIWGVTGWGI